MIYRFKLERVRHIREHERRLAEWNYAEALEQLKQAETALATVQDKQMVVKQAMHPAETRAVTIRDIQDHLSYLIHLQRVAERKQRERDRWQKRVDSEQKTLQQRRVKERVMDVLKARDYEAYCQEEKRKEQAAIDEIAITRHGRSLARGGVR